MSRIRTIKPEFWVDERLGECSTSARLLFIATWTFADDEGNLDRSSKQLKAQAFPYDNLDPEPLVQELLSHDLLTEYGQNGNKYLHINNFAKHQRIDRKSPPRFPLYDDSLNTRRVLDEDSRLNGREGSLREEEQELSSEPPVPPADSFQLEPPKNGEVKIHREAIDRVFQHYLAVTQRKPLMYTFTDLRRRKAESRLKECLKKTGGDLERATELMVIAVDGLAKSDFHMGRDAKTHGKRYCEWEDHLFGSYEQMEKWWNQE